MAQSASVAKLSIRHEAILHFLLGNPTVSQGEVAEKFGVTQAWLSVVMNSEAFLEARNNYTEIAYHETVLPLREKMVVAANKALDRLNLLIPQETDLDKVRKTAETTLQALGFGTVKGSTVNNNTQINIGGNASAEVLARARDKIGVRNEPIRPLQLSDSERGRESSSSEQLEEQDSVLDLIHRAGPDGSVHSDREEIRNSPDGGGEPSGAQTGHSLDQRGIIEGELVVQRRDLEGQQVGEGAGRTTETGQCSAAKRSDEYPANENVQDPTGGIPGYTSRVLANPKITIHGSGW